MNKILIIAYFFPPDGGAGTQRSLKLCKYLPRDKWEISVLTRAHRQNRSEQDPLDTSLMLELGNDITLIRIPADGGKTPRNSIRGFRKAIEKLVPGLYRKNKYDLIYVSLSPYQLAASGYRFAKKPGIPVILDIRDPWMFDGWNVYRHYLIWRFHYNRMKKYIRGVSGLITNTPEVEKVFKNIAGAQQGVCLTHITNGYDREDFDSGIQAPPSREDRDFILTHTGYFQSSVLYNRGPGLKQWLKKLFYYSPRKLIYAGRSPYYLLKAIKHLIDNRSPYGDRLQIRFVGLKDPFTARMIREFGLEHKVRMTGYLPHRESVGKLLECDGLFLPLHGIEPSHERAYIVPGKLYEYLAAGKPILAALPPGDARDFISRRGGGYLADPCDHLSLAGALERMLKDHFQPDNGQPPPDMDYVQRFERRRLAMRFSEFFTEVLNSAKNKK